MKNLKETLSAKGAMLTEMEASVIKGRIIITGPTTRYIGPPNPRVIYTYYNGVLIGRDPLSGSLFGDWWVYIPTPIFLVPFKTSDSDLVAAVDGEGKMDIG